MTPEIMLPVTKLRNKKLIWIYRYALSVANDYTFMMNFIGMLFVCLFVCLFVYLFVCLFTGAKAFVWRDMLGYEGNMTSFVNKYRKYMNFKEDYTWDIDQHIVTHSILKSGLCSLPKDSKLWQEVNLEPE